METVGPYIVITPARNEEGNLPHTIRSMCAQTLRPMRWIIVDDGSSDGTARIVDEAAKEHSWITALHRPDRGKRKQGGGVIETFYDGYAQLNGEPWEFLSKFDADLSFPPDYFAQCLARFRADPKIGIGGGLICHEENGTLSCESPGDPVFHVRGATKIYRRGCWDAIGGLLKAPGWDTIDELKANMLGWATHSFHDVPVKHHRFTGSADGTWKNYVKFGLSNYITGYHPLFMLAKCIKRLFERPYFVGSIGLFWGFCRGYMDKTDQVNDPNLIAYVRQQQINKLVGKPSLW